MLRNNQQEGLHADDFANEDTARTVQEKKN